MRACVKYLVEHPEKNKDLWAVEIGVHNGMNAQEMLTNLNIKTIYLVDPYVAYVDKDSSCKGWYIYDSLTVDNFRKVAEGIMTMRADGNKARFIRLPSLEAVNLFPNEVFDFVYIDAMHSRPYVDNDILAWYPKVKPGGMLGGHDWCVQDVVDAVTQFAEDNNIPLQKELFETDWFLIKGDSKA
jgi:hypothetical protein